MRPWIQWRLEPFVYPGIPRFSKVHLAPLHFYERPALVPVFAKQKISKEDFHFNEKRQKVKIAFGICFAAAVSEALRTPSSDSGPAKLLPRKHTQQLSIKLP